MDYLEVNTKETRRNPIKRNTLFYSEDSYRFDVEMGKEYLESDTNQTVILYEIDLEKTNLNETYKESKTNGIVFKTPVELHVLYNIDEAQLSSYDKSKNMGTYLKGGKLTFSLYQSTLDELGCDIKKGDYIGVQISESHIEFYTVVNDGKINYDNAHSIYGYKNPFRTIECAALSDTDEFKGF